jgi:hypothetical protein
MMQSKKGGRVTFLLAAGILLLTACGKPASEEQALNTKPNDLSAHFLLAEGPLAAPVPTKQFQPELTGTTANRFEGTLELIITPGQGGIQTRVDRFDYLEQKQLKIADLPPFRFDFIQDGSDLIPLQRGVQRSAHPHWEIILEPGKVWDSPSDGGYSRASLPFSLQERNANCTHNGLMTFIFQSDGIISRVAYQLGSETCFYLQIDMWGVLDAEYLAKSIPNAARVVRAYRKEVAARLPLRHIETLAEDYPGIDIDRFRLHDEDEVSTFGFVVDGVHYSGGCKTRFGPYPYCEVLDLPSYSLAKSVFAGSALAWLEAQYPGASSWLVTDYVPECRGDTRWEGVTLGHLLDMSSGNYASAEGQNDEFASYETNFMASDQHAEKIQTSCTLFPRSSEPGTQFVYHTTETYLAGTVMNAFLRRQSKGNSQTPDIYRDVLVEQVMKPLGLSPVTWKTKRTYDQAAQPLAGFGLTFHSDDVARFALFLMNGQGVIGDKPVLDRDILNAALQRDPSDYGFYTAGELFRYNNGFWAHDVKEYLACSQPVWVPFMSGYGGISIAMLPNNTVYYVFSDGGHWAWVKAAAESNKIKRYCRD